jgi:hypothetical protein
MVYQFLKDNSGDIDVDYTDASMLALSIYKPDYRQHGLFLIVVLRLVDFIYLGGQL